MIKIIATVSDATMQMHTGADLERESAIIAVPTANIPRIVKQYFEDNNNKTISFSLLDEDV